MPLRLEVADCEHLEKILPGCEDDMRKARVLAQRSEEGRNSQLSRFANTIEVERVFAVNSSLSDDRKYLVWKDSGEEAVLYYQGIVSQVCTTPFTPDTPGRPHRPGSIRQFLQVVSTDQDTVFEDARIAVRSIQRFMWQYGGNPDRLVLHDSTFGGIRALFADSKLLTAPSQAVGTTIPILADMEERNSLSRVCQDSKHRYTDDNVVNVLEWHCLDDKTMTLVTRDSGRALKPGHLVDVGVSFRLLLGKRGDSRFICKLDSVTIVSRSHAEKLYDLKHNADRGAPRPSPKKRKIVAETINTGHLFTT